MATGLLRVATQIPFAGGEQYLFKGPINLYQEVGIREATAIYPAFPEDRNRIPHRFADLLLAGVLVRIAVRAGSVIRPQRVLMYSSIYGINRIREEGTPAGLVGKNLPGYGIIRSVSIPRDLVVK